MQIPLSEKSKEIGMLIYSGRSGKRTAPGKAARRGSCECRAFAPRYIGCLCPPARNKTTGCFYTTRLRGRRQSTTDEFFYCHRNLMPETVPDNCLVHPC